ncbi:MAG: hypothetical protein Q4D12_03260 [Bacteroidales bacterium]|nr:hypothetical protein [Bacteroidales bacterium]
MKEKQILGLAFMVLFIILALMTKNVILSISGAAVYTFSFWWLGLFFENENHNSMSLR